MKQHANIGAQRVLRLLFRFFIGASAFALAQSSSATAPAPCVTLERSVRLDLQSMTLVYRSADGAVINQNVAQTNRGFSENMNLYGFDNDGRRRLSLDRLHGLRVLDVGTGYGDTVVDLQLEKIAATGIEVEFADGAMRRIASKGGDPSAFIEDDFLAHDFADTRFDVVMFNSSLMSPTYGYSATGTRIVRAALEKAVSIIGPSGGLIFAAPMTDFAAGALNAASLRLSGVTASVPFEARDLRWPDEFHLGMIFTVAPRAVFHPKI